MIRVSVRYPIENNMERSILRFTNPNDRTVGLSTVFTGRGSKGFRDEVSVKYLSTL